LKNVHFCPPSLPNGIYFSVYSIGVKSVLLFNRGSSSRKGIRHRTLADTLCALKMRLN